MKKCTIVIREQEFNETVKSCLRPLQRLCPNENGDVRVERIKRKTESSTLEAIGKKKDQRETAYLSDTFATI